MNDAYQQMSEMLDNLLSDNEKEIKIALIEKEVLLEKIRNLYVRVSAMETEEYPAPQQETLQPEATAEPKREFTPAKTLEEDVDLFFDTEHESYKAAVEKELNEIAKEIEAKEQARPAQDSGKKVKPEEKKETAEDVFDHLEEPEEEIVIDTDIQDNADELFDEPDIVITASEEDVEIRKKNPQKRFRNPLLRNNKQTRNRLLPNRNRPKRLQRRNLSNVPSMTFSTNGAKTIPSAANISTPKSAI